MTPGPTLVIGAGGLVGRHLCAALEASGHPVHRARVPWAEGGLARGALDSTVSSFAEAAQGTAWTVAWCAGAGVVATSAEALEEELAVFRHTLRVIEAASLHLADGVLVLASSAGGLYAGSAEPPFTEDTEPVPLVPYGHTKLAMERDLRDLSRRTGVRSVVARLANVYGPGQRLDKPQGLISQLALAHASGRPLPIYVSMDTIRDYVYAADCGAMLAAAAARARSTPPGTATTKIIASGRPVTIGHLLGEARRVFHRPLRTIPVGGAGTGQVLDLRLRSLVMHEIDPLAATPLAAGLDRTARDVADRVVARP